MSAHARNLAIALPATSELQSSQFDLGLEFTVCEHIILVATWVSSGFSCFYPPAKNKAGIFLCLTKQTFPACKHYVLHTVNRFYFQYLHFLSIYQFMFWKFGFFHQEMCSKINPVLFKKHDPGYAASRMKTMLVYMI